MWRRILAVGLAAGLAAGLLVSVVHHYTTTPLLLHAEQYEHAAPGTSPHPAAPPAPATLERTALSFLSTVLISIGFALLLSGCFAVLGRTVDGRGGVLWGLAGFAVFGLAPALGLPPEAAGLQTGAPGAIVTSAANTGTRQAWWLLTVACSGAGLALLVFGKNAWWRAAGVVALLVPHLIGAPPPPSSQASTVPAELALRFAVTSLVVGAVFWSLLGWLTGTLYRRWVTDAASDTPDTSNTSNTGRA